MTTGGTVPTFAAVAGVQAVTRTAYWLSNLLPVSGFTGTQINTSNTDPYGQFVGSIPPLWYIQGALEHLDAQGEFAYVRSTGYLYYWPRRSPITSQEIIVPLVGTRLLNIHGTSENTPVKNLVFQGIEFTCGDCPDVISRTSAINGDFDGQGREGLVYLENTSNISILGCIVRNAGVNGIELNRYNIGNTIVGNLVEDCGLHGIYVEGYAHSATLLGPDVCHDNVITDNFVRTVSRTMFHGSGIKLFNTGNNTVKNNKIIDVAFAGIILEGGNANTDSTDNHYLQNNLIAYNEIGRYGRDVGDDGGIYLTRTGALANTLDHNWVHDCSSLDGNVNFVYLDDWSRNTTITNNILSGRHNTNGSAFYVKSHHQIIRGNIGYFTSAETGGWTDITLDAAATQTYSNLEIAKNVLWHANGNDGPYWAGDTTGAPPGYYAGLVSPWGANVYWRPNGNYTASGAMPAGTEQLLISGGYDSGSAVADPLFNDPDASDFSFKSGSPATARGITAIDRSQIGLTSAFTVPATTFTVPYKAALGQAVPVSWANIRNANSGDWVALFPWGAADTAFVAWQYVNGTQTATVAIPSGSMNFTIPAGLTPGQYEFRLLSGGSSSNPRLAVSDAALTVTGTTGGVTVPGKAVVFSAALTDTTNWRRGISSAYPSNGPTNTADHKLDYIATGNYPTDGRTFKVIKRGADAYWDADLVTTEGTTGAFQIQAGDSITATCTVPATNGIWPAIWTWKSGDNEVDAFEYHPDNPTILEVTNHVNGGTYSYPSGIVTPGVPFELRVDINTTTVVWIVNGTTIYTDGHGVGAWGGSYLIVNASVSDGFWHPAPSPNSTGTTITWTCDNFKIWR